MTSTAAAGGADAQDKLSQYCRRHMFYHYRLHWNPLGDRAAAAQLRLARHVTDFFFLLFTPVNFDD